MLAKQTWFQYSFVRTIDCRHLFAAMTTAALLSTVTTNAEIFRWDNGEVIPGTEEIEPGPGVIFDHHELSHASLSGLNLTDSCFDYSNLTSANLSYSILTDSHLDDSNLTGAYLLRSNLAGANLSGADLRGVNSFQPGGAILGNTIFPDGGVQGLVVNDQQSFTIRDDDGVRDPAPSYWLTARAQVCR